MSSSESLNSQAVASAHAPHVERLASGDTVIDEPDEEEKNDTDEESWNARLLSFGSTLQSPKKVTFASCSAKTVISRMGTGDSHDLKRVRPSFVI